MIRPKLDGKQKQQTKRRERRKAHVQEGEVKRGMANIQHKKKPERKKTDKKGKRKTEKS